mmetsp:Transcript_11321/g.9715  ORF Transcript_11321/g.9715 Transcript_11321/m.9715 type:complete len:93 (-) Transcript_11321:77-355(-)
MGQIITKDLIENGHSITITNENKAEYVNKLCEMKMKIEVEEQLKALVRGFRGVLSKSMLASFTASEFELLLCGVQQIDIDEMISTCNMENLN